MVVVASAPLVGKYLTRHEAERGGWGSSLLLCTVVRGGSMTKHPQHNKRADISWSVLSHILVAMPLGHERRFDNKYTIDSTIRVISVTTVCKSLVVFRL